MHFHPIIVSGSLLAQDPCEGLEVRPNPTFVAGPGHECKPDYNLRSDMNRVVIRQPGCEGVANNIYAIAAHEVSTRKCCAVGGHCYVYGNDTIVEGRPANFDIDGQKFVMQRANEVNSAMNDGNQGKLGVQVLLENQEAALSAEFVGNFTHLLLCQMQRFNIAKDKVKTHFFAQFHPGQRVQELLDAVLGKKEEL